MIIRTVEDWDSVVLGMGPDVFISCGPPSYPCILLDRDDTSIVESDFITLEDIEFGGAAYDEELANHIEARALYLTAVEMYMGILE